MFGVIVGSVCWIRNTHLFGLDDYKCSACGWKTDKPYDRCPGCGADMHGQKDGESWVDEAAFYEFMFGRG